MDLRQLAQSILQTPGNVGKWGSENFIYDPKTKTPFPAGLIGASSRASKLPTGSKDQANEYIKMAMMAGLTSPKGYTPKITATIHPIDKPVLQSLLPEGPAPAGSKILPDDMDTMEKIIDYARLKQPYNHKTELMGSDLMDYYQSQLKTKGAQPKNMNEMANIFQKALETLINKK